MPSKKRKWRAGQTVYVVLNTWQPGRGWYRGPLTGRNVVKLSVTNRRFGRCDASNMPIAFDIRTGEADVRHLNYMEEWASVWGRWYFPTRARALKAARDYNLKREGIYDVPEPQGAPREFYEAVDPGVDWNDYST